VQAAGIDAAQIVGRFGHEEGEDADEHDHQADEERLVAVYVFQATLADLVVRLGEVFKQAAIEQATPLLAGYRCDAARRSVFHYFQD
jgi:hypothetical protein